MLRTPSPEPEVLPEEQALIDRFTGEHATLRPDLDQLRDAADQIDTVSTADILATLKSVQTFLVDELLLHEQAEDAQLYPVFDRIIGGTEPTGTMSRAHVEIAHHIRRISHLIDNLDPAGPDPEDLIELRRSLYGLHAILVLHFAQEDESYLSLWQQPDGQERASARR